MSGEGGCQYLEWMIDRLDILRLANNGYTKEKDRCWYFATSQINPQVLGYRCNFHPRVFQGIVSTEEREYAIYGFRLIKGHTCRCGKDRREELLDLESMPRRRDHVAVILRATGFDRLIQTDSSSKTCSIQYPNVKDY